MLTHTIAHSVLKQWSSVIAEIIREVDFIYIFWCIGINYDGLYKLFVRLLRINISDYFYCISKLL